MIDQNDFQAETDEIIKSAYIRLRMDHLTKNQAQELEQFLSSQILIAEEGVGKAKQNQMIEQAEEMYRRRTILKRIADGLAWYILDFNSEAINGFSIGHSPGFMAGKRGYQSERHVVKALDKLQNIRYAIQCDITNTLRVSDVLAVTEGGEIIPIEIKGTPSGRSQRQKKKVNQILKFLETGVMDNAILGMALFVLSKCQ